MPRNVVLFERFGYAASALAVLYFALGIDSMLEGCTPAQRPTAMANVLGPAAIAISVNIALIWLAARKKSNIARWHFLVFAFAGLPFLFKNIGLPMTPDLMTALAILSGGLAMVMEMFGLILVFSNDARGWFR